MQATVERQTDRFRSRSRVSQSSASDDGNTQMQSRDWQDKGTYGSMQARQIQLPVVNQTISTTQAAVGAVLVIGLVLLLSGGGGNGGNGGERVVFR